MTTEIVEYSKTEAALSDLSARYEGVIFDVATLEGMRTAVTGRAELRRYRVALEKTRKEIKEPALRRSQLIDSEARRISAQIESLESPIDEQIKKEEERKAWERGRAEREAKEKAESEEAARKAAEEAKLAAERADIARQRAELQAAEDRRIEEDRKARLKIEEEQRAARLKIEQEERAARAAREEEDRKTWAARVAAEAEAKRLRDIEEARLKDIRDKADAERRAAEEAQRKLRQEEEDKQRAKQKIEEDKQREIQRQKDEELNAKSMLISFRDRYSHIKKYKSVVAAINIIFPDNKEIGS